MLHLFLATPVQVVFDGPIESLLVPGTAGYFEVLKDHMPIIASLTVGKLAITNASKQKVVWAISGGIVEVFHNEATVLADAVELATEIDIKKAEQSLKVAHKLIETSKDEEELEFAKKELKKAKNRLKVAHGTKSNY